MYYFPHLYNMRFYSPFLPWFSIFAVKVNRHVSVTNNYTLNKAHSFNIIISSANICLQKYSLYKIYGYFVSYYFSHISSSLTPAAICHGIANGAFRDFAQDFVQAFFFFTPVNAISFTPLHNYGLPWADSHEIYRHPTASPADSFIPNFSPIR